MKKVDFQAFGKLPAGVIYVEVCPDPQVHEEFEILIKRETIFDPDDRNIVIDFYWSPFSPCYGAFGCDEDWESLAIRHCEQRDARFDHDEQGRVFWVLEQKDVEMLMKKISRLFNAYPVI